jgi:two-component system alkaline phosphatase synthesis response regulator PhoP
VIIAVGADETKFRTQLVALLEGNDQRVIELGALSAALAGLRAAKPHLLVSAYASGNGSISFIRGVRAAAEFRLLPVLCVDPKAGTNDTVAFLDAGADDAIVRPFQPPIFLARVRTLLRRAIWSCDAPEETAVSVSGGPIVLKLISRHAAIAGTPIELTRLEFDLLAHLLKYPDRAFKRDELLAAIWNYPGNVETRTLDKHVEALRRKVGPCGAMIQTVHGVGYRFSPGAPARS